MGVQVHEYENGMTGLAAFCDVCKQRITEHGFVVWDPENLADFLIIHQARCDPAGRYAHSMDLDVEIIYLANSVGADLDSARDRAGLLNTIR